MQFRICPTTHFKVLRQAFIWKVKISLECLPRKALIFNHHEVIHIINLGQMNVIPLNPSGCLYKAMNSKLSQTRMFLLKNNKK